MVLKGEFRGSSRKKSAASAAFEKENGSSTLTGAVKFGDMKSLKRLLGRSDTNLEETNDRGETALILAAMLGDMEALRLLVESGANVNAMSTINTTALMAAAQNGDLEALRYLLSKGADPDARKKDETTILMIAAMFGQTACVEALLAAGACVTAEDMYGYTALMLAAGCEECEELLSAAEELAVEMEAAGRALREAEKAILACEQQADTEQTDARPPGLLKKALTTAGKKGKKAHRASKQKNPPQEKPASKLTKPPA